MHGLCELIAFVERQPLVVGNFAHLLVNSEKEAKPHERHVKEFSALLTSVRFASPLRRFLLFIAVEVSPVAP